MLGLLACSCMLEIEPTVVCGDGYVDQTAGEECDPAVPSSFDDACARIGLPNGTATCDPLLCTIDISNCQTCGNGVLDEQLGEECDPSGVDDITNARECATLEPIRDKPYTHGTYGACRENCTYGRAGCSYCGDGELDGELELDNEGNRSPAEWCDGTQFDENRIATEMSSSICYAEDPNIRPVVACASNCLAFEEPEAGPLCCVAKNRPCPLFGSGRKCCFEIDNPQSSGPYCEQRFVDGSEDAPSLVCR